MTTDLNEWRETRRQGEQFTLPSGLVVRLKRVQLLDLAEQGQIPAPLLGIAETLLDGKPISLTLEKFKANSDVINLVCRACLMEPTLEDITELPVSDRLAIWNFANDVILAVFPFRQEPPGAEDSKSGSALLRSKTKRNTRN